MRRGLAATLLLAGCFAKPPRPAPDGPPPPPIVHVKSFAHDMSGSNDFVATPLNTGDAIVLALSCLSGETVTRFDLTALGWTFSEIGALTGPGDYTDSFGAFVPDTTAVMFHVSATPPCVRIQTMGDEFANVDPTGAGVTFDSARSTVGSDTSITVQTGHANDAVWAAMIDSGMAAAGGGFTAGAAISGNLTEYLITTDPAGTFETAPFGTTAMFNVLTAVTIKPR